MKKRDDRTRKERLPGKKKSIVKTSLYELIEVVGEEIRPNEEKLIPIVVNHILETGHSVTWVR